MAIASKYEHKNGWYIDRLLKTHETFYNSLTILHANTIYKDNSRLIYPPSSFCYNIGSIIVII